MNKKLLWLVLIMLIIVTLACSDDPLTACFERCDELYGDHDNNPITPMINRDKYYECVDNCISRYGYEK